MAAISVVVNTACRRAGAATALGSSGRPLAHRAVYLADLVLPRLRAQFDEVIVAGEYQSGDGYHYVHCACPYCDPRDVIVHRQAGFQATTDDVILFLMDDHVVDSDFVELLSRFPDDWDVLSPGRYGLRSGELLNSGWNDHRQSFGSAPYIHTHAIVLRRRALERCPWGALPPVLGFDVLHSQRFREEGLRLRIARELRVFDIEF